MRLLQRLKNLWKLSELDVKKEDGKLILDYKPEEQPKPRMAQIIRMENPIDKVLKNEE